MTRLFDLLCHTSIVAVFALGCAESRGSDAASGRDAPDSGGRSGVAGGAGNQDAGPAAAAGDGSKGNAPTLECLGPGRHTRGKGNAGQTCCAGLHEVPMGYRGYRSGTDGELQPSCDPPPLAIFACLTGRCGDGLCEEEGEAEACGCVEDCPQAAFTWEDTARLAQLSGPPLSCKRHDLLARLSQTAGMDCGDLALGASQVERDLSLGCARSAIAARMPFQIFWRTQGEDSIVHSGVIGRVDGASFETFRLHLDADTFGIDFPGATASWSPCTVATARADCDIGADACLRCVEPPAAVVCGCLPKGERPGASPGSAVELHCERR